MSLTDVLKKPKKVKESELITVWKEIPIKTKLSVKVVPGESIRVEPTEKCAVRTKDARKIRQL